MIEYVLLAIQDDSITSLGGDQSTVGTSKDHDSGSRKNSSMNSGKDMELATTHNQKEVLEDVSQPRPPDWARMLEAATQRRTEVLTPENLENMWTKGRNYKKKENKSIIKKAKDPIAKGSSSNSALPPKRLGKETSVDRSEVSTIKEEGLPLRLTWGTSSDTQLRDGTKIAMQYSEDINKESFAERIGPGGALEGSYNGASVGNKSRLKRSNSTSDLKIDSGAKRAFTEGGGGPIISEFYTPNFGKRSEQYSGKSASDVMVAKVEQQAPKLKCRVSIFSQHIIIKSKPYYICISGKL